MAPETETYAVHFHRFSAYSPRSLISGSGSQATKMLIGSESVCVCVCVCPRRRGRVRARPPKLWEQPPAPLMPNDGCVPVLDGAVAESDWAGVCIVNVCGYLWCMAL